ncbi:Fungalysin metallopeptidase-domain-containing protein [Desarmillaria tabescens]|uniref:Extracellular metalloproteinase n=1 Tax=Armillaria tabescens TaxID=1929756 RepID=A0AA39K1V0_ARMTA|nr:Fungalysin metallopeptidase-domain-containing protein [Desarmillaria tabescens]KAK0452843.1 Fungalysin metallopeptidase-domain-containing protein [Desarmillaria tabescens]
MRALGTRFFYTILLVVSLVKASPWPGYLKYSTHGLKMIGRDLKVDSYHPKTTYKTYGEGKEVASFVNGDLEKSTISFISSELGVDPSTIAYSSGHTADNDMSYAYAKQSHDGVPLANAVANVAFKNGKAVAFGTSFVDTSTIASSQPSITLDSIIGEVEDAFGATYNGINSLEYLAQADGSVALTYVLQVQNTDTNAGYEAFVDAHSGNIVGSTDFLAEATYTVLPITKQSVLEGEETLVNPEDFQSSPIGWVQNGETAGNNVVAYKGTPSNTTKESSSDTFDYPYDVSIGPTDGDNVDAARTNAFYIINKVHDFTYKYGWTESAYNFQLDNFGKGGAGGDRVQMSVQDSSGFNNANFLTLPDGQNGTCRMYVFTMTTPRRDGDLQNDIIVHEFTHGLTNRMTGGGTARCLQTYESAGMGEGWSDAMADWTEQKSGNITDFVSGTWVLNNTAGVRHYPYSTDPAVNPLRYSSLSSLFEVHDIGEVWANMLHNVHALLVEANGWSPTAMSDPSGSEGNIVYLHLFIDALALQPCNPTFVDARNAWIQADVNRYNGDHACTLWIAFASRGLGIDADHYIDDETIPYDC